MVIAMTGSQEKQIQEKITGAFCCRGGFYNYFDEVYVIQGS